MLTAFVIGSVGSCLIAAMGSQTLGWDMTDILRCILASNIAGLVSLIAVLRLEGIPKIRQKYLGSALRSWIVLVALYFAILFPLGPPLLRDLKVLALMIIPMVLSLGYCIIIFGPIQDHIVRTRQRKSAQ